MNGVLHWRLCSADVEAMPIGTNRVVGVAAAQHLKT
jgi:hypothetical protein